MKGYKQLNLEERELLWSETKQKGRKKSIRAIARSLNRSHSTVLREMKRNKRANGVYIPCSANSFAYERSHQQRAKAPLKSQTIYYYVREKLTLRWSPETIAGRLKLDYPELSIHHETIYRYIYAGKQKDLALWQYLTRARIKRRRKNGRRVWSASPHLYVGLHSIERRPEEVTERDIIGHFETDNLIGKMSDKSAVSTTVERALRYTMLAKVKDHSAKEKHKVLSERLKYIPREIRKSITTDNGSENAKHDKLRNELEIPTYFCHPYTSWEKGTVENMNGRIHRYIPKGSSIDSLTDENIAWVENQLNNTPRKCLNYQTPTEVMQKVLVAIRENRKSQETTLFSFV